MMAASATLARSEKRIAGTTALGWGKNRECTFGGTLESATAVTQRPVGYNELMGVTGLAFRVRWYQNLDSDERWCPSSPVGEFEEEINAASAATGWELRATVELGMTDPNMARYASQIVESLDNGKPVPGYVKDMNLGLIYGYDQDGETFFAHDYFNGDRELRVHASELKPFLIFLGERRSEPSRKEAALQGLRIAVRNWNCRHDPPENERRGYWRGKAALERWRWDLQSDDVLTDVQRASVFMVNWWNFDCLEDARRSAVGFLKDSAKLFDGKAANAILSAASIYERESNELLCPAFGRKDAFLGPWTGKSVADWTQETRAREADILSKCAALESEAIRHIETALSLNEN
jgi:hypothetical protein